MASTEEKVRVASRIPKDLDVRVRQFYVTSSSAIPEALELLTSVKEGRDVKDDVTTQDQDVKKDMSDVKGDVTTKGHDVKDDVTKKEFDDSLMSVRTVEMQGRIDEYKAQVQTLNAEISRLKTVLMESPDPVDLVRLQERNDGLNLMIGEKDKRIEDLTREVERLDIFAHYFKNVEIKQIEAPAAEKKPWWKFW